MTANKLPVTYVSPVLELVRLEHAQPDVVGKELVSLANRYGVTVEQLDDLSLNGYVQVRLRSIDRQHLLDAMSEIIFPVDYIDSYAREAKK